MTLRERMFYLIDKEGLNPNQFYTISGLGNGYLDKVGETFRKPTIEKIQQSFPHWNMDWILKEEGEPFIEVLEKPKENTERIRENLADRVPNTAHAIESTGFMNVPLIHVRAQCGYLNGYEDTNYIESLPTLPVIVDRTYHGQYRLFEAEGDSMDDNTRNAICDGDIVLGREVQRPLWRYKLHINDWYFIIVHRTDGITIKKITEHDVEHGIITCHPLNEMFKDFKICLDEVAELYNVIKIVDRSARL